MMQTGMLWRDDSKRTLEEKVQRAATYYHEKYGRVPDFCCVNTDMLNEAQTVDKIEVQPASNILPHHLWIGVQSKAN
ncbi:MAG: hypothetical protein KDD89_05415 [Anaerolineales bacterium]|nr:hypothetical protein [Anaerolineales bacterium]